MRFGARIVNARSIFDIAQFSGYHQLHCMNLAECYVTLSGLFGPSGNGFDSEDGSFSFPCRLTVANHGLESEYLVDFRDFRGEHDIFFYCQADEPAPRAGSTTAEQLTSREVKAFTAAFYGYLLGLLEHIRPAKTVPFVRSVPASRILYGCLRGEFFQERFPSLSRFQAVRRERLDLLRGQEAAFWALPAHGSARNTAGAAMKWTVKL